jgi:hypothetical protein
MNDATRRRESVDIEHPLSIDRPNPNHRSRPFQPDDAGIEAAQAQGDICRRRHAATGIGGREWDLFTR